MRKQFIKDNLRRLILILMTTALAFSLALPVSADASGSCGVGLSWQLSDGTLTISGVGSMTDFVGETMSPWYGFREEVRVINVQSGVTSIGDLAFYGLENLVSATLPNSVKTIGFAAFAECRNLKILTLGSGVETIGRSAFECCEALQSVRFPDKLISIGERAFYRCYELKTVSIPASVRKLGVMAFTYCHSLVSATVSASIAALPTWAFYGCSSLAQITVAGNISEAKEGAFSGCENLSDIYYGGNELGGESLLSDIQKDVPEISNFAMNYTTPETGSVGVTDIEIVDNKVITTTTTVTGTDNSVVSTTVSSSRPMEDSSDEETTTVKVDAVIENENGWNELVDAIKKGEQENIDNEEIKVDVSLNDAEEIAGETLNDLAGKNVHVTIDMKDGSTVKIDCTRLEAKEEKKTEEKYELSYTLTPNTAPTKSQTKTLGDAQSYLLSFDGSADFDFSPKIYIGKDKAYSTATLYQNVPGRGLSSLQSVIVDKSGYATFYLQSTKASTEYVIGLNVTAIDASSAIIPEDIAAEYGDVMYYESIQYVTTGVRLFMGLSLFQFTIAVVCVMLFLFLIVGIVMGVVYRKKKLELYYQSLKENRA